MASACAAVADFREPRVRSGRGGTAVPKSQPAGAAVLFELRHTLAELLDASVDTLADSTYLAAELDVDSLMDVALVVEDAYQMTFTESELRRIACLGDIAELTSSRLRAAARLDSAS